MRFLRLCLLCFLPCAAFGDAFSPPGMTAVAADARYVNVTGDTVIGDLTVTGDFYSNPSRAFAFLTEPSNTVVSVANQWYPVAGIFSNEVLDGFSTTTVGGDPAIVYTNGHVGRMAVRLLGNVACGNNNRTVSLALKLNGVAQTNLNSTSSVRCATAGEPYQIYNFGVPMVTNGTTIQIIATCDNTETLTFSTFKAMIDIWE